MEVRYSKKAQKSINKMDKATKDRRKNAIERLKLTPPEGDIKDMQGVEYEGYMRLRVGQYRIIFRYDMDEGIKILFIYKIGPRGDVYK